MRRFSYRRNPDIPSNNNGDSVQVAFGVFPPGENGMLAHAPGMPPDFQARKCTDYEYVLNAVAQRYGGGTEMWRLAAPGVPRKHFYPRQPKAEKDGGPVPGGKLAMHREGNTRIVEAAIPWAELPDVRSRLEEGRTIRFSYRVNNNQGAAMELAAERSVSQTERERLPRLLVEPLVQRAGIRLREVRDDQLRLDSEEQLGDCPNFRPTKMGLSP